MRPIESSPLLLGDPEHLPDDGMSPLDSLVATRRVGAEPDGGEGRLDNVRPSAVLELVPIHFEQPTDESVTPPKALGHPLGRGSFRLGRYQFFAVIAFSA